MRSLLDAILRRSIVQGSLRVIYPDGASATFAGRPGAHAAIRLRDPGALRRIAMNPNLAFGEAYVDGALVPEGCGIYDVLDLLLANFAASGTHPLMRLHARLGRLTKRWAQFNPLHRARRNAAHHYDIDDRVYALLLDQDQQYSCAYFARGDETLDEAQAAKKRHVAAKLLLRPGMRVLDIGCGWGGLALSLARDHGADVTGVTLSARQHEVAQARAAAEGLSDRVRFELADYRTIKGTFDRVVSVGMFEHVGISHYGAFFAAVRRCLAPDGVALVHAIGRLHGPEATNPWLAKYIFPGGYSPALSEVLPAVERSGLLATDIEILRLHYAETLRRWRANLAAHHDAIAGLHDERFVRMFEFYLAGCEVAFHREGQMVWQMQLAREHAAVPLTRDYISDAERAVARATQVA